MNSSSGSAQGFRLYMCCLTVLTTLAMSLSSMTSHSDESSGHGCEECNISVFAAPACFNASLGCTHPPNKVIRLMNRIPLGYCCAMCYKGLSKRSGILHHGAYCTGGAWGAGGLQITTEAERSEAERSRKRKRKKNTKIEEPEEHSQEIKSTHSSPFVQSPKKKRVTALAVLDAQ